MYQEFLLRITNRMCTATFCAESSTTRQQKPESVIRVHWLVNPFVPRVQKITRCIFPEYLAGTGFLFKIVLIGILYTVFTTKQREKS